MNWKNAILEWLKKLFTGFALKKILGSAIGGIRGFFVKIAINVVWKKWIKPATQWIIRKLQMIPIKLRSKKKAKRMDDAKTPEEHTDAFDDMP